MIDVVDASIRLRDSIAIAKSAYDDNLMDVFFEGIEYDEPVDDWQNVEVDDPDDVEAQLKHFIDVTKSFKGHKGRPGQVGGSVPRLLHATTSEAETSIDKRGFKEGSYFLKKSSEKTHEHIKAALEEIVKDKFDAWENGEESKPVSLIVYSVNLDGIGTVADPELRRIAVRTTTAVKPSRIVDKRKYEVDIDLLFEEIDRLRTSKKSGFFGTPVKFAFVEMTDTAISNIFRNDQKTEMFLMESKSAQIATHLFTLALVDGHEMGLVDDAETNLKSLIDDLFAKHLPNVYDQKRHDPETSAFETTLKSLALNKSLAEQKAGTAIGARKAWLIRRRRQLQDQVYSAMRTNNGQAIREAQARLAGLQRLEAAVAQVKHLPNMHDQKTHGRSRISTVRQGKFLLNAKMRLAMMKKDPTRSVNVVKNLLRTVYSEELPESIFDTKGGLEKAGWAAFAALGIVDLAEARSVVTAAKSMIDFLRGDKGLANRVKAWIGGKKDIGLETLWAATQLVEGNDVVIHRGMAVSKGVFDRINSGNVKLVDIDTIGHWSKSYAMSREFSEGSGNSNSEAVIFVAHVSKQSLLFSSKLYDPYLEREVVPIFGGKVTMHNRTISANSYDEQTLVVDIQVK